MTSNLEIAAKLIDGWALGFTPGATDEELADAIEAALDAKDAEIERLVDKLVAAERRVDQLADRLIDNTFDPAVRPQIDRFIEENSE